MELVILARIIGPTIKWDGYDVDRDNRKIVFHQVSGLQATAYKLNQPLHRWAIGFTAHGWTFGLTEKAADAVNLARYAVQNKIVQEIKAGFYV